MKTVGSLDVITLLPLQAVTASGNTSVEEVYHIAAGNVFLNVTAISGTSPTLDVKLQITPKASPAAGDWYDLDGGSFTRVTGVGKQVLSLVNFGHWMRFVYTVGGTSPSITFELLFMPSEYSNFLNIK